MPVYESRTIANSVTNTSAIDLLLLLLLQGIKFKVIGPPSSQDVIDACAKDAVRYVLS